MSDQDNTVSGSTSDDDESLSTQDMEDVSGGACMTFVDSAGCSNTSGGGDGGGATSGGTGTGSTSTTPPPRGH